MSPTSYDGELVPVILLPRFTTLVGQGGEEFLTLPLDMKPYESARITLWHAPLQGSGPPAVKFFFDESTDRDGWTSCKSTPPTGVDFAADTEHVESFPQRRRWFRLRVRLDGTNPAVTCWAQGFLIKRQH